MAPAPDGTWDPRGSTWLSDGGAGRREPEGAGRERRGPWFPDLQGLKMPGSRPASCRALVDALRREPVRAREHVSCTLADGIESMNGASGISRPWPERATSPGGVPSRGVAAPSMRLRERSARGDGCSFPPGARDALPSAARRVGGGDRCQRCATFCPRSPRFPPGSHACGMPSGSTPSARGATAGSTTTASRTGSTARA